MNFKSSGGCKACNAIKSQGNNKPIANNMFMRQGLAQRSMQSYRKITHNNTQSNLYKMPLIVRRNVQRMF